MKYTATALYVQPHNSIFGLMSGKAHCVAAIFHDELQIVYEGLSRAECLEWCHSQGIGMKKAESYRGEALASFD